VPRTWQDRVVDSTGVVGQVLGERMSAIAVAVEKLLPPKFAKLKSRQEALQTTFSVFLDIFYPPTFLYFDENGLFQQPQTLHSEHGQ
jgi:hypothetical protein